ncbi:MAG: hypothetical protein AB7N71_10335 [Phycisphaerae bacterium]
MDATCHRHHNDEADRLYTLGEIAEMLEVPIHRANYAVASYRIQPTQRAGILRLFDASKIESIKSALKRTSARSGALA